MKNTKTLLVCFLTLFACKDVLAQHYRDQNKIWTFGNGYLVDFNAGSPTTLGTSNINTVEGCATVCDASGSLLFYSDGMKVYNRMGTLMPSGSGIVPFSVFSSMQPALAIPVIGSSSQYYLFSLGDFGNGELAYCKIDMTLDGGMGDIVPGTLNTQIGDTMSENMIAITGNDNNIWLVTHKNDTALFVAYNISAAGISAPVYSHVGTLNGSNCYTLGFMRASANRRKIAQVVFPYGSCYGTFLYDFNPATGIVSNGMVIDTSNVQQYGVEFSPDSKKVYANSWWKKSVFQFDITLPTAAAIQASKYKVTDSSYGTDLRLGPDGKIYFRGNMTYDLHCISAPNLSGAACNYMPHAVTTALTAYHQSFPNVNVGPDTLVTSTSVEDIALMPHLFVYPNPARTEVYVTATSPLGFLSIANIMGQQVYHNSYHTTNARIDISTLPPGMYFIKVNGAEVRRIVVER